MKIFSTGHPLRENCFIDNCPLCQLFHDLATAAKLYTGTPTGVSPCYSAQVQKTRAVIQSPKAVYVQNGF